MSTKATLKPYSIRLPQAVIDQADAACAKSAALSRNDFLIMAIERGLPVVEQMLSLTADQLASLPSAPVSPVMPADDAAPERAA